MCVCVSVWGLDGWKIGPSVSEGGVCVLQWEKEKERERDEG